MVRVDLFKPSGKWYEAVAVNFQGLYSEDLILDSVKKGLERRFNLEAYEDWKFVILEPYHKHACPICYIPGSYKEYTKL